MEELTSSKHTTFLERSLPTAFAPGRNVGVQLSDRGEKYSWALGAFHETDDSGRVVGDDRLNLTGRIAFTPIYQDDSGWLLHVGVGISHKDLGDSPLRLPGVK